MKILTENNWEKTLQKDIKDAVWASSENNNNNNKTWIFLLWAPIISMNRNSQAL